MFLKNNPNSTRPTLQYQSHANKIKVAPIYKSSAFQLNNWGHMNSYKKVQRGFFSFILFSNFSCMFLNPNHFFQFEFQLF